MSPDSFDCACPRLPSPWALWKSLPTRRPVAALLCLGLVAVLCGMESAYVQVRSTHRDFTLTLGDDPAVWTLAALDILMPLGIAFLSRKLLAAYAILQAALSAILLHYALFFYNTLTLASIYHSSQGATSLGLDIFSFAVPKLIFLLGLSLAAKLVLIHLSRATVLENAHWKNRRRILALASFSALFLVCVSIYARTGLCPFWAGYGINGNRAVERSLEQGARESVRCIGYTATWLGEFLDGSYKLTEGLYVETPCDDPDMQGGCSADDASRDCWNALPIPPLAEHVVLVQVESLDFAALDMKVTGHPVTPFLDGLAKDSLLLKVFAPHKLGSSNSDYELLNGRIASQNIMYYDHLTQYPDSVLQTLNRRGYRPAVLHGLYGSLFNLRAAYAEQGAVAAFFKEELLEEGYAAGPYIMQHIMDADVFDRAARYIEEEEGNSVFVITMTSHIPFIDPMPIFSRARGSFARYVSSLRYLDESLAAFYARLPEGTLLILWGDHGSDVKYPREFPRNTRHVPFLVHIKGDESWLDAWRFKEAARETEAPAASDVLEPPSAILDDPRIHTLCELHFLLRRIFRQ